VIGSAAILVLVAGSLLAGPLSPPAGPVASSYKTLTEVEPRTAINATNTPGDADSVFRITQSGTYYLTGNVTALAGRMGIEVATGWVTIDLNGFQIAGVPGSLDGINALGGKVHIRNGFIVSMGGDGVDTAGGSGSSCEGLSVQSCTGVGVRAGSVGLVKDCIVESATGVGILTGINTMVVGCTVSGCQSDGISLGEVSRAVDCSLRANQGNGIVINGVSVLVRGCTSHQNRLDGIRVDLGLGTITGNVCTHNGLSAAVGAGINIGSTGCMVEDNYVANNDTGILVTVGANSIVRNHASFNTVEYNIAAGNCAGPIVTSATIAASSNPHANYDL